MKIPAELPIDADDFKGQSLLMFKFALFITAVGKGVVLLSVLKSIFIILVEKLQVCVWHTVLMVAIKCYEFI